jgi:photosystem II stability/assembly factor-like uncharacterized protein
MAHCTSRLLQVARATAILLPLVLASAALAQIDLDHPPKGKPFGTMRDLAPESLPLAPQSPSDAMRSAPSSTSANVDSPIAAYQGDATINDMAFADSQHGWAVGDCGTILHTVDGGRHWLQQSSDVDRRLQSVVCIDEKTAWAVGGQTAPYTHLTSGVVVRTLDSGEHWSAVPKLLLPALWRIQLSSPTRLFALGQSTAMYSCGLFFSADRGRTWSVLPTTDAIDCVAGYQVDAGEGLLALADGRMAIVRAGRLRIAKSPPLGLAAVRQVQLAGPLLGWAVGDGGLVLNTADGGRSWQSVPWETLLATASKNASQSDAANNGSAVMRGWFDFTALFSRGPKVWIAGSPGNCVIHSSDAGRTWDISPTEQTAPISAIAFADERHGWIAGALGTIEMTDDGGHSWHIQRGGHQRVALLGIFSEPRDIPLELFARVSAADGYRSAVEVVNRRDVELPDTDGRSLPNRTSEALASLGVAGVDFASQFPLRQPGLEISEPAIKTVWDQTTGGDGLSEIDAHLVRQIRIWRPSVVVTSDGESAASDTSPLRPAAELLRKAILQAVRQAADPASGDGLAPWRVSRVFAAGSENRGGLSIDSAQLSARLGQSLAELAWQPRGIISDRFEPSPDTIGLRMLDNPTDADSGSGDLFSGLGLRPGGDARRELAQPTLTAIENLRRAALDRRNAQAILRRTDAISPGWLAQLGELTGHMDSRSAGALLFARGQGLVRIGQLDAAAQIFEMLVNQYPTHPLAPPAERWLLETYESNAAERQIQVDTNDLNVSNNRLQQAVQIGSLIERTAPDLFAEPAVRLPMFAAYRRLGMQAEADRLLVGLRGRTHDAFWECAATESWLAQRESTPPKRVWHCAIVGHRPHLDGLQDDPIWQHAEPVALHCVSADDTDSPATAKLACDEQFLYLAVCCRRTDGVEYTPAQSPRPRQADLSIHDHIDLLLSPDRDWATYHRLSIDDRGWVNCGCSTAAPWQPTCYIAAGSQNKNWIVEMAIPWDQLVAQSPLHPIGRPRGPTKNTTTNHPAFAHAEPWAVNIQRTIPGVGFQSWSTPASVAIRPEGFGLLIFEQPKPASAN